MMSLKGQMMDNDSNPQQRGWIDWKQVSGHLVRRKDKP